MEYFLLVNFFVASLLAMVAILGVVIEYLTYRPFVIRITALITAGFPSWHSVWDGLLHGFICRSLPDEAWFVNFGLFQSQYSVDDLGSVCFLDD